MSHHDRGRFNGFRYRHQALRSAMGWLRRDIDFSSSCGLCFMAPSTVASPSIQVDEFTGLVWSGYSSSDTATTIKVLSVPKDHLAVAVVQNGGNLRAGSFWAYEDDGIGNRTGAVGRSGAGAASYTTNKLNQITARTNPRPTIGSG